MDDKKVKQLHQQRQESLERIRGEVSLCTTVFRSFTTPDGEITVERCRALSLFLLDSAIIYALQIGMSREEALAWASDSFDLYSRMCAAAKDGAQSYEEMREAAALLGQSLRQKDGEVS